MKKYSIYEFVLSLLIVSDVIINLLSYVPIEYTILNHILIFILFYQKITQEGTKQTTFYLMISEFSLICHYYLVNQGQYISYICLGVSLFFILFYIYGTYNNPEYKIPIISKDKLVGYKVAYHNGVLCSFYYPAKLKTGNKFKLRLRDKTDVQKFQLLVKVVKKMKLPEFYFAFKLDFLFKAYIDVYQDAELAPNLNSTYNTIIFCPGFSASSKSSSFINSHVAIQGYIIVSPDFNEIHELPDMYSGIIEKASEVTIRCVQTRINFMEDITKSISNGQFYTQFFNKQYKQGNTFVIGHSLGGAAALRFGLQTKYQIDGILLYDPFLAFQDPDQVNIVNTNAKIFGIASHKYQFSGKHVWTEYLQKLIEKNQEIKNRFDFTVIKESGHLDYGDSIFLASREFPNEQSGYEHVPQNFQIILQGTLHFLNNLSQNNNNNIIRQTRKYLEDNFKSKIYFFDYK